MRKLVAVALLLVFGTTVAFADEFFARITKIDGNKITFKQKEKEEATLTAADNVKVQIGKFNFKEKKFEDLKDIDGGLKSEKLTSGKAFARITTEGDKITQIAIGSFGGKKKPRDKDK